MAKPPAPPAERKSGATTESLILEVSTDLFTRQGFDRVTTRMIANACDITVPTIYLYFKDKRTLYLRCCVEVLSRARDPIANALTEPTTPEERIYRGACAIAAVLFDDPHLGRLFQRELVESAQEGMRMINNDAFRKPLDLMNEAIAACVSKPAPMTGLSIFALIFALYEYSHITPVVEAAVGSGEDRAERLAKHVIRVLTPEVHERLFA